MDKKSSSGDRICLQVFAQISAAVSHEIKNTLAIINENAGLLDDLAQLTGQTGGIPVERVQDTTLAIKKQVERSNLIMQNVNRFAHSCDSSLGQINLQEMLNLIAAMASRQAAMKKMTIKVECLPDLSIYLWVIGLEALIYLTLRSLIRYGTEGSSISIDVSIDQSDIVFDFVSEIHPDTPLKLYPDDDQSILAEQLKVTCCQQQNQPRIIIPAPNYKKD